MPLRFKLVLVSITVEIVMLGLLLGNSLRLMNDAVKYHAETLVENVSPLLDNTLSPYMFERDYVSIQAVIDKLVEEKKSDLNYIIVLDESGKVYASSGWDLQSSMPKIDTSFESALNDERYDTSTHLQLGGQDAGQVLYGVSLANMIHARSNLLQQGLFIASIEVFLTILLLSIAGYLLTRHIFSLVRATRQVAEGDYSTKVKKPANDEIGQLADNFNTMTAAVQHRIEELNTIQRALTDEKERILVTLNSIGDGVITTDVDGRVELLNPVAEKLTGWSNEKARGLPLEEVFKIKNEVTGRPVQNPVMKTLETGGTVGLANHTVLVQPDGTEFPIEDSAAPIRDAGGEIIGVILVFHDVSSTRQMARQMAYQAKHDPLTGLVNRCEFELRVNEALLTAKSESRHHSLFYIDLDQFKIVNDTCGHFAGDELLKQLTTRLKSKIRDSDTLARLGGDEFGVLLENCDLSQAEVIAENLRKYIKEFRFEWDDKLFEISASIGVVPVTSESIGMAEALSAADVACYIAKEKGRDRIHIQVAGDEEHALRRSELQLVSDISLALEEGRFSLHFQKINSTRPGAAEASFYELLVRMQGQDQQLIPAYKFISAAERFQLMQQIDRWVVTEALIFMKTNNHVLGNTRFAINLSGQSINSTEFHKFLVAEIKQSTLNPKRICFEITETAAISNLKNASQLISDLKKLGCMFSLDDFGSGLSSFAYLKNLHVDYLKIDGGFIKDMLNNQADASMVEAIHQIGHVLGLKTIAEYVENKSIQEAVENIGVDYVQGYGIHKPEPLTNLAKQYSNHTDLSVKN